MSNKLIRWAGDTEISRWVKIWIITGVVMIFMQIVIGGVTRLTGSGLSITRWEIVIGAVPPLGEAAWQEAFDLYKETPQYHRINKGMNLDEFKFIYFWEYFHRLWARLMFFVFIIPFGFFLLRGMLSKKLARWLLLVVLLAGLEGFFGWIMVKSGLRERPWVNAYNLTLHLCMGFIILCCLLWTSFLAIDPKPRIWEKPGDKRQVWGLFGLAFFQIALGAMMSGAKAGLFYPSWPDMNGTFLPSILLEAQNWKVENFLNYDTNPFMPALIQFFHRNTAYILSILIVLFSWEAFRYSVSKANRQLLWGLLIILGTQVLLGIFTLINCIGKIPVALGVFHQAFAVVLLGTILYLSYRVSQSAGSKSSEKS